MTSSAQGTLDRPPLVEPQGVPVIDADVHQAMVPTQPEILAYLPTRWRRYIDEYGIVRGGNIGGDRQRQRQYASRWDAVPPEGGIPGSNPQFAAEQLLDRYGMVAAVLNDLCAFRMSGARNQPKAFARAFNRAVNEYVRDHWFAQDERWYGSITIPFELPSAAVEEIRYCMEEMGEYSSRWRQVLLSPDNLRPPGHEDYWPIYEVCEHYGLAIGYHVLSSNRITPSGSASYYFEEHCDFAAFNFPLVSSFIFEGVFDRFPTLQVALVELGWSWAIPYAWRLDHAFDLLQSERPPISRRPSEYLRDHFWYTTQPMEEPEGKVRFSDVFGLFADMGFADHLMYSSDYPHWDFDEPSALPRSIDDEWRRRVLAENASRLYRIPLPAATAAADTPSTADG